MQHGTVNPSKSFLWSLCVLWVVSGSVLHASENWAGYEDGYLHHNASTVEINPAGLKLLWQRTFDDPVSHPGGVGSGVTHGSRNLVSVNGNLAILQPSEKGLPREFMKGAFAKGNLSILDANSGKTLQCIGVTLRDGNRHNWWYPTGLLVDAADTLGGMHVLHWDAATGILFIRSGGDGCFATAYKPLANLESYKEGTLQEGVPAFTGLGTRGDPFKISNTETIPFSEEFWQPVGPNNTSFFSVDPNSPVLALAWGVGHTQAGGLKFSDKQTGLEMKLEKSPALKPVPSPPYPQGDKTQEPGPFLKWQPPIVADGRIYYLAAGDDNDATGKLGDAQLCSDSMKPEPEREKDAKGQTSARWKSDCPDQGLHICAYNFKTAVDNGRTKATLTPAFIHRFVSPHKPEHGPADCESYLETDHFYRNKTFLVDGKAVWAVWQKSKTDGAELICADDQSARTWPLNICKDRRGQDVWGHLSLARVGDHKYITYYAGNAFWQKYLDDTPPYRPVDCFSPVMEPPLGPAEFVVFNVATEKIVCTYNLSARYPSLPPNLAQHYLDQSHMVAAGKWAYVGWLDLQEPNATLRLVAFDVTGETSAPVENSFPLDFKTSEFPKSQLTDLIAVDGRLHALITQAKNMSPDIRMFEAQRIVTLRSETP